MTFQSHATRELFTSDELRKLADGQCPDCGTALDTFRCARPTKGPPCQPARQIARAKDFLMSLDEATASTIARQFHDVYERLAPEHGWESQTPVAWEHLPYNNKLLMLAVVRELPWINEQREQVNTWHTRAVTYRTAAEAAEKAARTAESKLASSVIAHNEIFDALRASEQKLNAVSSRLECAEKLLTAALGALQGAGAPVTMGRIGHFLSLSSGTAPEPDAPGQAEAARPSSCGHREGWKVCILPPGHDGSHLSG